MVRAGDQKSRYEMEDRVPSLGEQELVIDSRIAGSFEVVRVEPPRALGSDQR